MSVTNDDMITLEGGETFAPTFALQDPTTKIYLNTAGWTGKMWVRDGPKETDTLILSTEAPGAEITCTFSYLAGSHSTAHFEAPAETLAEIPSGRYYYQRAYIDADGDVAKSRVATLYIRNDLES